MAEYYGLYPQDLFLLERKSKYCYTEIIIPGRSAEYFPNFTVFAQ